METPVDDTADLFKDYEATTLAESESLSPESPETPECPAIKINQVTSIPQEDFPAIEIEGATSISEAAFLENPSVEENEGEESGGGAEAVEITALQTEGDKEQEPVNEVEEDHQEIAGLIKRELEVGDDLPNRDDTESDVEMDPEIAAALKASLLETHPMKEEIEITEKPSMGLSQKVELSSTADNDGLCSGEALAGDDAEEFTIEGVAEIGENPLESEYNPLEDPGDLDPFYDEGEAIAVDEDTSGFLEKVNSGGFMTTIHSFPEVSGRGGRGPYNKKKQEDDDYDPLDLNQPVKPKRKSRAKFQLKCNFCQTAFESIGELKHHKFTNYGNQPKPSYLDLTEVLLSKYKKRGGITHKKILTELLADPLVEETAANLHKARTILMKALKFGVEVGRLRMGKKNVSQRCYLAKVTQRRQANLKFNRNKKLVEFVITEPKPGPPKRTGRNLQNLNIPGVSITRVTSSPSTSHPMLTPPDTKNYGRGLRQGIKNSIQVARAKPRQILPKPGPASQATVTLDSDSDDEIEVISEKITPQSSRPKLKIVKVRSTTSQPVRSSFSKLSSSSSSSSFSSSQVVVKLGPNSKSSSEKSKTVKLSQATKKDPVQVSDPFAEDEDLTCRVCHSAFWFRSQIVEHLASKHHVQDPEAFLREKRTRLH